MRYHHIDPEKFFTLFQKPLWHQEFFHLPELREVFYSVNEDVPQVQTWDDAKREHRREVRKEIYHITQRAFSQKKIALGQTGKDWDAARKSIDTIVIHCYEFDSFTHENFASVVPFVRLYIPSYATAPEHDERYNAPIWSNHFDDAGDMQFWTYHWLVQEDGTIRRLLKDTEIGWHAGNWDVNCRSVAISLPVHFDQREPDAALLDAAARIIREQYSFVPKEHIIGHCEVVRDPKYTNKVYCPGKTFLEGWKGKLLALI